MKRSKLISLMLVVTLLAVVAVGCSKGAQDSSSEKSGSDSKDKIVWKFGYLANEDHIWHKTAEKFAKLVDEKTDGRLEVKLYPNEQLGGETDTLNMIRDGSADMTISAETMQNWAPKAALMAVPYAFKDGEHMIRVIEGDLGKEIADQIIEKVGVTPIYYHVRSPRNLTSNKPIRNLDDVRGLKIRVPNVPLFVNAWKAVGAQPQVMDFSEVFTALQQNVIEAQENPYDLIYSGGLHEVQKYVNETEHVNSWIYVVVGNKQLAALPDDIRDAVMDAAKEAQMYADQMLLKETAKCKNELKEKGMEIISDVDKEAFAEKMASAVLKSLDEEQKDLYERILKTK